MVSSLVSLISKKIIKPSILTLPSLKCHKLSFVDQVMHMSISMAFFYPNFGNCEPTHVSQILEKSLSKGLSFYYPYGGRLNKDDGNFVDCNDMGVELSHVRVHCPMSQIFTQPYTNAEHVVFPVEQPYGYNEGNLATTQAQLKHGSRAQTRMNLALIPLKWIESKWTKQWINTIVWSSVLPTNSDQVSHFDCGGIAIGGCLSHKIGDGCTASNFNNWGILSRDISATLSPHFVGESIYPQSADPSVVSTIEPDDPKEYLGKKIHFPC
ncbi:acyltransferase Pun1-like [Solanum dulcamara]|uniref:acyltransferase Pun1-like n=1 Tax=Solanum dulcamara TaxID=45834 RepID=UPI002486BC63|nr:acyltransferase Pun1-like [Solanum dulcamara]